LDTSINAPPPVATLTVVPAPIGIRVGQAVQFRAIAWDARGGQLPLPGAVEWSSGDTSIVRVSANGVGVGISLGTATISADLKGVVARAAVGVSPRDKRPNVILIVTDDARSDDIAYMPTVQRLLVSQGLTFSKFFVTTGTCCPSRSSILRGQYAHNHGTLSNVPPAGSFLQFRALGNEHSTVASWLQAAGYRTALLGKYLNRYPGYPNPEPTYVPPGWTEWYAVFAPSEGDPAYYDYLMNENGHETTYGHGPQDYLTDVLTRRATRFVRQSQFLGNPFFMYIAPYAPHQPSTPGPNHVAAFAGFVPPRSPAFNEADVSDKWLGVSRLPLLTDSAVAVLDSAQRLRLESLLSVDDMVRALVDTLQATAALDDTYIFLSSDNGLEVGEHRLWLTKETPYEETIRLPLLVRGPGVAAGGVTAAMALNIDLAPTFAELASVPAPSFVDGRSLVPFLQGQNPPWRHAFAEEVWAEISAIMPRLVFQQVRTENYSYIEFYDGERELYDLGVDPYELQSIYKTAPASLLTQLSGWLKALRGCVGPACRTLDVAP